mgnify:CR=1 FL=1
MKKINNPSSRKNLLLMVPLMMLLTFFQNANAGEDKKTNIYVTDPKLNVFRTVIEGAVRARNNTTEGLARFALQPTKNVRYDPIKYDCRLLHWREAANPTYISDKSMNGDYKNLTSANIEFIGVQPTSEQLVCVFDEVKIVGTYKEELVPTKQPVTPGVDYGARHIESMTVSVFQFKQSDLQTCIDRFGADQAESACNITTYRQTAPSIVFRIPSEEINRIGLRSSNNKPGYWKAGFTPKNVEGLSGGKKDKHMNINMHNDRGELYFESLTILE